LTLESSLEQSKVVKELILTDYQVEILPSPDGQVPRHRGYPIPIEVIRPLVWRRADPLTYGVPEGGVIIGIQTQKIRKYFEK